MVSLTWHRIAYYFYDWKPYFGYEILFFSLQYITFKQSFWTKYFICSFYLVNCNYKVNWCKIKIAKCGQKRQEHRLYNVCNGLAVVFSQIHTNIFLITQYSIQSVTQTRCRDGYIELYEMRRSFFNILLE